MNGDIADYLNLTAVDVTGCGFAQTYLCWEERAPYGDDLVYSCQEIDLNDSNSELGAFSLSWNVMQALREQFRASAPH